MLTQTAVRTSVPLTRSDPPVAARALSARRTARPDDASDGSCHVVSAQHRNLRRERGRGLPVQGGERRCAHVQDPPRRAPTDQRLPGDIFGLEFADEHTCSAEAITDAKVLVIKRKALTALADRNAAVARELFALTARELRRTQERVLLLIKSAQERVASFLLEMAERGLASNVIELPMSRQDIADYLGLTIETVSRTLTALEICAAIDVPSSRRIVLRSRSALNRMHG